MDKRWTLIAREPISHKVCSHAIQENADAAGQIREAGKQGRTANSDFDPINQVDWPSLPLFSLWLSNDLSMEERKIHVDRSGWALKIKIGIQ